MRSNVDWERVLWWRKTKDDLYRIFRPVKYWKTKYLDATEDSREFDALIRPLKALELGKGTRVECIFAAFDSGVPMTQVGVLAQMLLSRCDRKGWLYPQEVGELLKEGKFTREHLIEMSKKRAVK